MEIYNCYKELDSTKIIVQNCLNQLKKSNDRILQQLNQLSSKWNDNHFKNLYEVLNHKNVELKSLIKNLEQSIIDLDKKSSIIKSYYTIAI